MNENFERLCMQMSLRVPQEESLRILSDVIETLPLTKDPDNGAALSAINALETPKKLTIKDFERDFPSICFSVATGVGKTRLMGAFITYLYLEKGIKNFFIVAPNLTIYNKLIADFTPNTPKYVFQGIPEFATRAPLIITGENYQNMGGLTGRMYENNIKINIFNISKINRDKDAKGTPRFRSFSEYLGKSYFEYLQSLSDLVLLMDEAHRYRATAGMKIINELNAVLGLELTATAKSVGENAKDFKNIIYHYPLAQAINDKYVKKPTIVGRSDFEKEKYNDEQLEEIKLTDGFKVHEDTKAELAVYSDEKQKRLVKPFLLVIARDTAHADELKDKIDSDGFKGGAYRGKVIVVHSNQKGTELDENVALLLEVEKAENPVEVVIHVNMLAEGWDVNNLYTIVPLKAARTEILVEQSIGRGLRLPYGEHTGVDSIDRLNIVAHDKFNDIVETARKEGFEFQRRLLDSEADAGKKIVINAPTSLRAAIENAAVSPNAPAAASAEQGKLELTFANQAQKDAALAFNDKLEEMGKIVSSMEELKSKEMQERIISEIVQDEKAKGNLFAEEQAKVLREIATTITEQHIEGVISVPQVSIYNAFPQKSVEYKRFSLDLKPFEGLRAVQQKIIKREILDSKVEQAGEAQFADWKGATENPIIVKMLDNNAIPYNIMETLMFFAKQATDYIRTYTAAETEVRKIVFFNDRIIAEAIIEQMVQNVIEPEMETIVKVSGDYTPLRSTKLLGNADDGEMSFRNAPKDLKRIRNYIFTSFKKCLSTKTKFDSDTERQLSNILEDEPKVLRWERLTEEAAKEKVPMKYYKEDRSPHDYCPDFIVEASDAKYIVETKAAKEMTAKDVLAKQAIAKRWCEEATKYEQSVGGKPWRYILIPHDTLVADRSWDKLVADWSVR